MDENGVTTFGGIVGRVLRDATSIGTAITAFILGATVVTVGLTFTFIGNRPLAHLMVQVVVALALARFALNGLSGEFRGTILSTAGGPWALAVMVAARYLVLNLLWMAPTGLVLWQAVAAATSGGAAGMEPGGGPAGAPASPGGGMMMTLPILAVLTSKLFIASVVFALFGLTLLPPIFLIVAVRAERFGQIFSGDLWRETFSGRFADVYVLYAIHGGGVGMTIIMAVPMVLLGFSAASEFGILFAFMAFAYMGSLAITLLGRLCGFFAFGEEHMHPVYATAPAGGAPDAPTAATGFTPRVVRGGVASGAGAGPTGIAADGSAADSGASVVVGGPLAAPPVVAEETADDSGRPRLPDADARAAAARTRFATDPDGAIADLEQACAEHAPSASIMHALALCLHEAGRAADALDIARRAMPLCIARGQVPLAAEIFATFWKQAKELGLDHTQIDAVASSLMKSGDLNRAVSAYGLALTMDPSDRKAIKGLLQAADQRLYKEGRPRDAAKIYTFLLQYAPNSPFAEDMRRGLAEAEARLARAS